MKLARIHLDPIGGLAGDMFAAAMADAFPECLPGLMQQLAKLSPLGEGRGEGLFEFAAHAQAGLAGQRFIVHDDAPATPAHSHQRGEHATHLHVPWRDIRARLQACGLDAAVLRHALALFALLAQAEAKVHGCAEEDVEFHEVGAWDSIVDFVAAAHFIATLAPRRWTCAPLPLGGGRVETAHGVLPVPAPATALLLQGLDVIDDGIGGERVTPTGAAIARYLLGPAGPAPRRAAPASPEVLCASGQGFGSRTLPGVANMLRCLAFTAASPATSPRDEEIAALQFEIDDQTAEDLAVALDRIRQAPGVLDAAQMAVFGKKGRLATQVQVLVRPEAADEVADLCLAQTTTLGVRISRLRRRTLARAHVEPGAADAVRVKVARRPGGAVTAKAEMDDLAQVPGDRARREEVRGRAQSQALESTRAHEHADRSDD